LLIVFASSRTLPSAPVFSTFSEPAKSTRIIFPAFTLYKVKNYPLPPYTSIVFATIAVIQFQETCLFCNTRFNHLSKKKGSSISAFYNHL
jgi:hypothetical protein